VEVVGEEDLEAREERRSVRRRWQLGFRGNGSHRASGRRTMRRAREGTG
jgi:hypothetical protein